MDALHALEGGDLDPELVGRVISILPEDTQTCLSSQLGESGYDALAAGAGTVGIAEGVAFAECLGPLFEEASRLETDSLPEGSDDVFKDPLRTGG